MTADFLIIANSARFLAESAHESDYSCVAVDGFGDADLSALDSRQLPWHDDQFDDGVLLSHCDDLLNEHSPSGVVIGPGFDNRSDLMAALANRCQLFGNTPAVFSQCADMSRVHNLLDQLEMPYPALTASSPSLHKSTGACGGGHIRWTEDDAAVGETYLPGVTVSHLFFADGEAAVSVGFNTQWCSAHNKDRPFCYGGAINRCRLNDSDRSQMEDNAAKLGGELGLIGLNSIDYIKTTQGLYCLEINPRPSATMQLYPGLNLFRTHIRVCQGEPLPIIASRQAAPYAPPCAHAVVYATDDSRTLETANLPEEVRDIPATVSGTAVFKAGDPICSIRVSADTILETLDRLNRRMIDLFGRINVPGLQDDSQARLSKAV